MVNLGRRNFLIAGGACLLALTASEYIIYRRDKGGLNRIVLDTGSAKKNTYTMFDFQNDKSISLESAVVAHSFLEYGDRYIAIPKLAKTAVLFTFLDSKYRNGFSCPPNYLFNGHGTIIKDKLLVTGVKFDDQLENPNYFQNSMKSPGVIFVFDIETQKLENMIENIGYGPHEIISKNEKIYLALAGNSDQKACVNVYRPDNLSLESMFESDEEAKTFHSRHLAFVGDKVYSIMMAVADNFPVGGAIGLLDNQKLKVAAFEKSVSENLDSTTFFTFNEKLYLTHHPGNHVSIFSGQQLVETKIVGTNLEQFFFMVNVMHSGRFQDSDLFKHSLLSAGDELKFHSHIKYS